MDEAKPLPRAVGTDPDLEQEQEVLLAPNTKMQERMGSTVVWDLS